MSNLETAAVVVGVLIAAIALFFQILDYRRKARASEPPPIQPAIEPETAILQVPIPPGPPLVMRDRDFEKDIGADRTVEYEIIKPTPDSVVKYERRGFERIYITHRGQSCQVVIDGTADKPDLVPLQRKKIREGAKKVLRTAYSRSARPDLGYCFVYDALSENPTVSLDDGTQLEGYYATEALKDLYGNQLAVPHPTERDLYWLTETGKGWAQDIIERRLV